MNDREIILADGTSLEGCSAAYDGALTVYCQLGMREGAALFTDPETTREIRYKIGGAVQVYTGCDECEALNRVPGGLRVVLAGEVTEMRIEPEGVA